jgi:pilus assembly protein CpaB
MDRRRLLLILAVFVAIIGTALVFLYVQGADKRANDKYDNVSVLKATSNIAAGETYDSALAAGKITSSQVPRNQLNTGYESTTTALKGKIAAVPIFAGQQIISSQFSSNTIQAASTNLPIPKGMIAISVQLTDPERVAGNVYPGSKVAIFASGLGGPEHRGGAGASTSSSDSTNDEVALLLPDVLVLNVGDPVQASTTTTDETGTQTTETLPRTLLTLAVSQAEAEKIILAETGSGGGSLTLGLLTNTSVVKVGPGTTSANIWRK